MIPFFVVDRPISLDLVRGYWSTEPDKEYGLMANALTTDRFRGLFARYPCGDNDVGHVCTAATLNADMCPRGVLLRKSVVKMGDSGIFDSQHRLGYEQLFARYEEMGVDYGVMIDYLRDSGRTLKSARQAIGAFGTRRRSYRLVLVAQGRDVKEYTECYRQLREMGDFPIAIGGMLRRRVNSARYVHVAEGGLLDDVLRTIRREFDPTWLFVLGVYHPARHRALSEMGVTGADYKGWIFNYEHRRDVLADVLRPIENTSIARKNGRFRRLLERREALFCQLRESSHALRGKAPTELRAAKQKRQETIDMVQRADTRILKQLTRLIDDDGLVPADRGAVDEALTVLRATDQEIRFQGVHDYFRTKVLPNLEECSVSPAKRYS